MATWGSGSLGTSMSAYRQDTSPVYLALLEKAQKGELKPSELSQYSGLSTQQKQALLDLASGRTGGAGGTTPYGGAFVPGITAPPGGTAPVSGQVPGASAPGSGGAGNTIYGQLISQYQQAQNEAKAANEERYKQLLQENAVLAGKVEGGLSGLGAAAKADISRTYQGMGSQVGQDLVNRGLANTSIGAQERLGVAAKQSTAEQALNEQLRREKLGYDIALSEGKQGIIERRTDSYPDYGMLAQLAQGLGTSGYGYAQYTPSAVAQTPTTPLSAQTPGGPGYVPPQPGKPAKPLKTKVAKPLKTALPEDPNANIQEVSSGYYAVNRSAVPRPFAIPSSLVPRRTYSANLKVRR